MISRIIPKGAWHVRVHEICTEHEIDVADSGFAIAVESGKYGRSCVEEGPGVCPLFLHGASAGW